MIPSGYKEDVVYSQIPTSGAGDLSFTRASNGTRINSAGLVEVTPWNMAEYSEDFSNAVWTALDATITTNVATAPNGTTTADRIDLGTLVYSQIAQTITNIKGAYNFSLYIRSLSGTQTIYSYAYNDVDGLVISTAFSVGTSWTRIDYNFNVSKDSAFGIRSEQAVAKSFYIWGAQLNIGSTAKPYFPTTDRLNVPRLTYQNGGGGCPSLLLEKQSTNLFTYSEQMENSDWFKTNLTVTANSTTSPDGTQNADLLDDGTASGTQHWIYQGPALSNSIAYTISFYAKYVSRKYMAVNIYNGASSQYVTYDIQNGVVYGSTGDVTASMTSVGNGWYRVVYTRTMASSGSPNFRIALADDTGDVTYTGSNKQVYLWGMQLEASSYPTSYIPTTSSSATRVADLATVNLPNTNMTFTAYLELDEASLGTPAGDWFSIFSNVSALGRAYGYANQFGFADAYSLGVSSGAKMVWKQESGSTAKIFKGGALVGTSTTGTYTDPFNRLRMDGALLDKSVKIKQFVFFDNALTDAECIQLTA